MRRNCPRKVEVDEGVLEKVTVRVRRVNGREEEEECLRQRERCGWRPGSEGDGEEQGGRG